ncbi:hypothetical protein PsorP6_011007 [Peronosclerospora sorghi]|uniref:Uncharacterized protein n=1 Tax=Peronosclerospora sorghi TaxID=230839 RepID=A0ACC0VTR5_9STRA|nr:hypothetical protein PsorP6_011007 [Peronosclerospora sorghi]
MAVIDFGKALFMRYCVMCCDNGMVRIPITNVPRDTAKVYSIMRTRNYGRFTR